MNSFILLSTFVLLVNLHTTFGQGLSCTYANNNEYGYSCYITILNPNGFNNFTTISGAHLAGKSDYDVQSIIRTIGSNTLNVPSIICNKFPNTKIIVFDGIKIQRIDENTFDSCKNLTRLWLHTNSIPDLPKNIFTPLVNLQDLALSENIISNISVEWFKNMENLEFLYLHNNRIEELPRNVFSSLKKLEIIYIGGNELKIIHSDSFGILPNLKLISLYLNQINAIDERLIDVTGVETIHMIQNLCANIDIFDDSPSRQLMRNGLRTCFDNYKVMFPETTTPPSTTTPIITPTTTLPSTFTTTTDEPTTTRPSLPPGCIDGNLDERVCRLEDRDKELEEKIHLLTEENKKINKNLEDQGTKLSGIQDENERLTAVTADMQEQIEDLQKGKKEMQENLDNQSKVFSAAIEELESKILELSSRPCACR